MTLAYYSRWLRELEIRENYDFEIEARKLIERAILEDTQPQLPITGTDIIQEFSIVPGPKVGELLLRAKQIFDADFCGKDELLARLRREMA